MSKIKHILQAFKQLAGLMRPGIVSGSLAVCLICVASGIVSACLTGIAPGIVSAVSFSFIFCPYFWRASCKDTAAGIASAAIRVQTVHRAGLAGSVQIASYQAGRRAAGSPPDGKFYHLWPMPY